MSGRVLFVDDDPAMGVIVQKGLARHGFAVEVTTSGDAAFTRIVDGGPGAGAAGEPGAEPGAGPGAEPGAEIDVVVTDLRMAGLSGIELAQRIAANVPDLPVIVITAFGSLDTAIAAMRAGAYDFVPKPFELDVLALAVTRAARHRALTREVVRLRARAAIGRGGALLGESAAMREVFDLIERVAETDASVLITGESGTGKELVARAIHERSRRRAGKLVTVNCAAMPEALLENELFGHVRGAFTDARADHAGLFVAAAGGTLFLDEIGELPLALQPKLLRALQERKVRPLGSQHEIGFDVRLITATNRDLESAIDGKTFREDLYYRIHVVHLPLPPLRARGGDVMLLAQSFLGDAASRFGKQVRGFGAAAADKLTSYTWPGNVRELANAVESAVALARFDEIGVDDLPVKIRTYTPSHVLVPGSDPAGLVPLEEVERRYILHVLEACGRNQSLAAQILRIDRKTLHRRLKSYLREGEPDG